MYIYSKYVIIDIDPISTYNSEIGIIDSLESNLHAGFRLLLPI